MERLTSTGRCWIDLGWRRASSKSGARRRPGGAVHAGGGQGVEVSVRWAGGDRAHGSGAVAAVARGADLSRVRERERQGTRRFFG
jgi:hypothetical protein